MKKVILYHLIIILFLVSCGTPKQSINYRKMAANAYEQGNYQQAIESLNKYLDEQELNEVKPNPTVYSKLAEAYLKLDKMSEAERYYNWAMTKNAVSRDLNVDMSNYYKKIDNLSKEITALEYYRDHFTHGRDSLMMRHRLFETYIKSENWKPAQQTWEKLDEETKNSEEYLQMYFLLNKEIEHNEKCDEIAQQLIKINPDNQEALEWMAKKYYYLGEDRYQSAMKAYDKNKTNKQYQILLKELDLVTADLKKSLKYFDKLWDMKDGKQYAVFLANIYARFDDKQKSQYYKSFIK